MDSLWIAPFRYAITYPAEVIGPQNEKRLGQVDLVKCAIEIDGALTPQRSRETLLHEVIHAIDCTLDLDLDEKQVIRLSNGLTDVLVSNPDFIQLFAERG